MAPLRGARGGRGLAQDEFGLLGRASVYSPCRFLARYLDRLRLVTRKRRPSMRLCLFYVLHVVSQRVAHGLRRGSAGNGGTDQIFFLHSLRLSHQDIGNLIGLRGHSIGTLYSWFS